MADKKQDQPDRWSEAVKIEQTDRITFLALQTEEEQQPSAAVYVVEDRKGQLKEVSVRHTDPAVRIVFDAREQRGAADPVPQVNLEVDTTAKTTTLKRDVSVLLREGDCLLPAVLKKGTVLPEDPAMLGDLAAQFTHQMCAAKELASNERK